MKLRIIQVFDTACQPWYRLQQRDNGNWNFVNGDSKLEALEIQAKLMMTHAENLHIVVKEFGEYPQLLVDNSAAID